MPKITYVMGRPRTIDEVKLGKIRKWMRIQAKLGTRQQLAAKLGMSDVTLSRYMRAIKYGVVDQAFNHSGYILNRTRTGYIGAKPRKKRGFSPVVHHCALQRTGGDGYMHTKFSNSGH